MSGDPSRNISPTAWSRRSHHRVIEGAVVFRDRAQLDLHYKGRAVDVKQVGRELGGALRARRQRAQSRQPHPHHRAIGRSRNRKPCLGRAYDRDLADIFAVQDEITSGVAAIEPELYAAEQVRSQSKPPDSLDAWECVIRALSLIGQGTRDEKHRGRSLCRRDRRAIAIAPSYGRAHSLLAWALLRRTVYSGELRTVVPEIGAGDADRTRPRRPRPLGTRRTGPICSYDCVASARRVRASRRASSLNPNFALAHALLAGTLALQGANQEAVDSAEGRAAA